MGTKAIKHFDISLLYSKFSLQDNLHCLEERFARGDVDQDGDARHSILEQWYCDLCHLQPSKSIKNQHHGGGMYCVYSVIHLLVL